jgi:hypothetical protein
MKMGFLTFKLLISMGIFLFDIRETSLKSREALYSTQHFNEENIEENLKKFKGHIELDPPNNNIYKVEGVIHRDNSQEKLYFNINNILLRGGILMNVDHIYGLVIYTGKNTKIMRNIK